MNAKDETREQLRRLVDEGLIKTAGHAQRREDALDAYAAAAVAEARAPLVEALSRIAAKTTHINEKGCRGHLIFTQVEMAAIAATALAKETP